MSTSSSNLKMKASCFTDVLVRCGDSLPAHKLIKEEGEEEGGGSCGRPLAEELTATAQAMAPQYAPSLRSRLAPMLFSLQTGFIVLFSFCTEIENSVKVDGISFSNIYPGELVCQS